MSNDHFDQDKDNDCSIALDDLGIPILEDIVLDDSSIMTDNDASEQRSALPNNEELLEALKNQLKSNIQQNLDEITIKIARKVVDNMIPSLERRINSQLNKTLAHNLDKIIDNAIKDTQENKPSDL